MNFEQDSLPAYQMPNSIKNMHRKQDGMWWTSTQTIARDIVGITKAFKQGIISQEYFQNAGKEIVEKTGWHVDDFDTLAQIMSAAERMRDYSKKPTFLQKTLHKTIFRVMKEQTGITPESIDLKQYLTELNLRIQNPWTTLSDLEKML